jgi:BlaI family penicillinase repressor
MTTVQPLGELQLAIMQVLWQHGEASVADVHAALLERQLAPTTIATMLTKMEQKGLVEHRAEGRKFLYRPLWSEAEVRRISVEEVRERLFGGDTAALVSHLIAERRLDRDELSRLKALIAEAERRQSGATPRKGERRG